MIVDKKGGLSTVEISGKGTAFTAFSRLRLSEQYCASSALHSSPDGANQRSCIDD